MPFLRPHALADLARYTVCIPDTPEWRTQLWGAISILLLDYQWEGDSSLSDLEIASEYLQVLNSFERCPMEAGIITAYGGETAPNNWLLCDGSLYAQNAYPELYAAIGGRYGGGIGIFSVPNLRERFPLGLNTPAATPSTGGASTHTLTPTEMPQHSHWYDPELTGLALAPGELPVHTPGLFPRQTSNTGGDGAHNNQPPYLEVNYIISTGKDC